MDNLNEAELSTLPPGIDNLLRRLQSTSKADCVESLSWEDLQDDGLGSIFGGTEVSGSDVVLSDKEVSRIRLQVMTAIGNCRTLEKLILYQQDSEARSKLSDPEMKALLEHLQSSRVLVELDLNGQDIWFEDEGLRILGKFVAINRSCQVLRTKTGGFIDDLKIRILTEPLNGNGNPSVKVWHLHDLEYAISVEPILRVCPALQSIIQTRAWSCQGVKEAERYAKIYSQHKSYNSVWLKGSSTKLGAFLRHIVSSRALYKKSLKALKLEGLWLSLGNLSIMRSVTTLKGNVVSSVTSISCELQTVSLIHLKLDAAEWHRILLSLQKHRGLEEFASSCAKRFGFDEHVWNELAALIAASSNLKNIALIHESGPLPAAGLCGVINVLASVYSLKRLQLEGFYFEEDDVVALISFIKATKGLEILEMRQCKMAGGNWEEFFGSLRGNNTLQRLDLKSSEELGDGAFKELMTALQINPSLLRVEATLTTWAAEGKLTILEEALKQKERSQIYMAIMRQSLPATDFQPQSSGRLFLCGEPNAGKTQLRETVMDFVQHRDRDGGCWFGFRSDFLRNPIRRTEGIEIDHVIIDGVDISIWDLAGQEIFRALQNCLFPRLTLACMFLFVFSPYDRQNKCIKHSLINALKDEIFPWLRFIASNSRVRGGILPHVKVLVSHKDKMENKELQWAKDVVKDVGFQFQNILDIDQEVLFANNAKREEVADVLGSVQKSFKVLLQAHSFKIPETCAKIAAALSTDASKFNRERNPLYRISDFYPFCKTFVPPSVDLRSLTVRRGTGRRLLHAILEFLHDAGSIIHLKSTSELVVVDPNWLTYSFLGRLVASGHGFQSSVVKKDPYVDSLLGCLIPKRHDNKSHVGREDPYSGRKDGLISDAYIREVLGELARRMRSEGFSRIGVEQMQLLMTDMDMCYAVEEENTLYHFAPTFFAEPEKSSSSRGLRKLPEWTSGSENAHWKPTIFVGLRLQCADPVRTTLSPAFFPRFQVHYRNNLIHKKKIDASLIKCSYNLIQLTVQGYEIYVESDGFEGDHIDILVRSSHERGETINYVMKHVIMDIQQFCASSKGCQGVALVVGILRSECVGLLTVSAHRGREQTVLMETLKANWKEHILEMDVLDDDTWKEESKITSYIHTWPASPKAMLRARFEQAKDILRDEDFKDILKAVTAAADSAKQKESNREQVEAELDLALGNERQPTRRGAANKFIQRSDTLEAAARAQLSEDGNEAISILIRLMLRSAQNMAVMQERMEEMRILLMGIRSDVRQIKEVQNSLRRIDGKLDKLIGFPVVKEKGKLPRRPFFTRKGAGFTHRICARINVGIALTLHFMCEERTGNHVVADQEGLELIVEEQKLDNFRFMSLNSIKVLNYLLKAGVHLSLGVGEIVPDLNIETLGGYTKLTGASANTVLEELKAHEQAGSGGTLGSTRCIDEESWAFLKQIFAGVVKDEVVGKFGLFKTRYSDGQAESEYAWLCQECVRKGRTGGYLQECE